MTDRRKIHYGWVICLVGTLIFIGNCGFATNVMPAYFPFLKDAGYTGTQTSFLVSIRCGFSVLGTFLGTAFCRKVSIKADLLMAAVLSVVGYVLMAAASAYWYYIVAASLLGLSQGAGSMIPVTLLVFNWFSSRRATAMAIGAAGSGVSAFIFPPFITSLVKKFGLSLSFFMTAGIAALVLLIILLLVKDTPEQMGLMPYDGGKPEKKKIKPVNTYDIPRKLEIAFLAAMVIFGAASMASYSHYSILFTTNGYTKELAALAVSFNGAILILGKVSFGAVADRIGGRKASFLYMAILIVGISLCCFCTGSVFLLFLAMFLSGFGLPPASVGLSVWADDFATADKRSSLLRNLQMCYSVGGMLMSTVPGSIYDLSGSYVPAFVLNTGLMLVFTGVLIFLYRKKDRAY